MSLLTLCLQSHDLLKDWAETISLEEVNAVAASYLSYISHYQAEQEILEQAADAQGNFAGVGPVRATAIVACIPAFTDPSGQSTGELCIAQVVFTTLLQQPQGKTAQGS